MDNYQEKLLNSRAFAADGPGVKCIFGHYEKLTSTMDQARKMLESDSIDGDYTLFSESVSFAKQILVVTAKEQTAGRGRKGRYWVSQKNTGLWMSIAWENKIREYPAGLSLSVGIGIRRALEKLGVKVLLKWPNDIVVQEDNQLKKLGGILIEVNRFSRKKFICVGIGINYHAPSNVPDIKLTHLEALAYRGDYFEVFRQILVHILYALEELYYHGFSSQQMEYNLHLGALGKEVMCSDGSREFSGKVVGVDNEGKLLLDQHGRRVEVYAGDVRIIGIGDNG